MAMRNDVWNAAIETLDAEEMERQHNALLFEQLEYVKLHSRFYQKKFAHFPHISHRTDFVELPFTEKDELRVSQVLCPPFGDYLAVPTREVCRVHKTSGTTGRPLYIAMTRRDIDSTRECG